MSFKNHMIFKLWKTFTSFSCLLLFFNSSKVEDTSFPVSKLNLWWQSGSKSETISIKKWKCEDLLPPSSYESNVQVECFVAIWQECFVYIWHSNNSVLLSFDSLVPPALMLLIRKMFCFRFLQEYVSDITLLFSLKPDTHY